LFQHLSPRFKFDRYLIQKLKTVVLPYLLLSIPALIIFTLFTKRIGMWPWFYDLPTWGQVTLFLLTGKHLAPLWFVPTIALFYLLAPLFLFIDRKFRWGYWLIVPLLVVSTYVGRDGPWGPLDKALYLLPIYLLGMAFSHYKALGFVLVQRWWPLLAGVAATLLYALAIDWQTDLSLHIPLKTCLALLFTWLLWRYHMVFGTKLNYIAEISFGIFFIHAYFISFVKVVMVYLLTGQIYKGEGAEVIPGNALTFSLYVGSVLAMSVLAIWVVKKLFGNKSRMVIGA
jgi:surface polysaccharide O-acyltransferase-like enzyme